MAYIKEVKNKKGTSFQVNIRKEGYQPVYKTFKGERAEQRAKKWARQIESEMELGIYKEFVDNDYNIEYVFELIDYFDKEVACSKYSHYEKYKVMFSWWKKQIGHVRVKELTASQLAICKNTLKNEKIKKKSGEVTRSPNTVNKYLMALSAVLRYAANELELIEVNPMSKVDTLDIPEGRKRFADENEINALSSVCKNHSDRAFLFFLLLFKTGGRYNEVRHLTINDIDQKNKRVYYLDTKNRTSRSVHIGQYTLDVLNQYIKEHNIVSGYIFKSDRKGTELAYMKGIMEECIKKAGLSDFHIHDTLTIYLPDKSSSGPPAYSNPKTPLISSIFIITCDFISKNSIQCPLSL